MGASAAGILVNTISNFLQIYSLLMFLRILLTWFPNVDWSAQPFAALSQITDPYLNLFRSVIPPLGGIDFSSMLAIILLQVVQSQLVPLLGSAIAMVEVSLIG